MRLRAWRGRVTRRGCLGLLAAGAAGHGMGRAAAAAMGGDGVAKPGGDADHAAREAARDRAETEAERALQALLAAAEAEGRIPGALTWVERADRVPQRIWRCVSGQRARWPQPLPVAEDTVYDIASLTKPFVAVLALRGAEQGWLDLDAPLQRWLPAFEGRIAGRPGERVAITPRHLLAHSSGLPAGLPLSPAWSGADAALALACSREASDPPGAVFRYSDVNFILLGELLQRASGRSLPELLRREITGPLGMDETGWRPTGAVGPLAHGGGAHALPLSRIAPTQLEAGTLLHGVVHDPTARRMGGVAGHAGLFAPIHDLALWARRLAHGAYGLLRPDTFAAMTRPANALAQQRGLGWDIASSYSRAGAGYPAGGFGHTGFTGCAMWIHPPRRAFHILLSNRVHPDGGVSAVPLYEAVSLAALRLQALA